jgi:hypothetical protein
MGDVEATLERLAKSIETADNSKRIFLLLSWGIAIVLAVVGKRGDTG